MALIKRRELLREVQAAAQDEGSFRLGALSVANRLTEALSEGHLRPGHFSLRDLFVALVEGGGELLESMSFRKSGGMTLQEAGGAVDTQAFANITGQLAFNMVKDEYESPAFLYPELSEVINTDFIDGERIPGIGGLGDVAEIVGENQAFPEVGTNEDWVQTSPTIKRGFIVPVTREAIIADRTGVLERRCKDGGRWLGLNTEKRTIDVTTGVVNNYNRNGVASNTYLTSGAYVNSQTGNALDGSGNEWRALEKAELLFDAITDPNTGEPIIVTPETLLVPTALKRTALRIVGATDVTTVDMRANAATIRTTGKNPYSGQSLKVLSSPYVKLRSGSATKWWFGQPKRAVARMVVWDVEPQQAPGNSEAEFTRDVMLRFKVSLRDVVQMLEPRYMTQNDQ